MQTGANTCDSNVVQRGTTAELLSGVNNGNYTIGTNACAPQGGPVTVLPATGQGAVVVATPSAQVPVKQLPPLKTLPPAGSEQLTFTISIAGSILTVLGILGLALL